jgi:hypothetical protein
MEHFKEITGEMRRRRRNIREELYGVRVDISNLLSYRPDGRQGGLDIKKVLTDAASKAPLVIKNQSQHDSDFVSDHSLSTSEVKEWVEPLRDLLATVETKVEEYEIERRQLFEKLKASIEELTAPNDKAPLSLSHRYTLRGVSTTPSTVYVLRSVAPTLAGETSASDEWQWWHISSSSEGVENRPPVVFGPSPQPQPSSQQESSVNASGPYTPWLARNAQNGPSSGQDGSVIAYSVNKVSEEDVLQAVREEHDTVLLVYASDNAVNFSRAPDHFECLPRQITRCLKMSCVALKIYWKLI